MFSLGALKPKKREAQPGEKSRYDEAKNGAPLGEDMAKQIWLNQHRDRSDSGHTVLGSGTKSESRKDEKEMKRAAQLFSQGKIEEAAQMGLPVALGTSINRASINTSIKTSMI